MDNTNDIKEFDGKAWVSDSSQNTTIESVVCYIPQNVPIKPLPIYKDRSIPIHKQILGGSYLDSESCSAGVLELPPLSKKNNETSFVTELLVVVSCEHKKLKFTIGEKVFYLSKTCVLHIPDSNEYSLENISQRQSAKLLFFLLGYSLKMDNGFINNDNNDDNDECLNDNNNNDDNEGCSNDNNNKNNNN